MPDAIALALIVNRINELAPELRSDLATASIVYVELNAGSGDLEPWEVASFARLRAFHDALTCGGPMPERDPRD